MEIILLSLRVAALKALRRIRDDAESVKNSIGELNGKPCDSSIFLSLNVHLLINHFLMPVEDVFSISGRGTVGTGRIESG